MVVVGAEARAGCTTAPFACGSFFRALKTLAALQLVVLEVVAATPWPTPLRAGNILLERCWLLQEIEKFGGRSQAEMAEEA